MLEWLHNPLQVVEEFIRISADISRYSDIHKVLETVLSAARRLSGADSGVIYILDQTKTKLLVSVNQCESLPFDIDTFETIPLYANSQQNFSEIASYCTFTGKIVNIDNVYKVNGFNINTFLHIDRRQRYKTKSVLAVPMRNSDNHTLGILQLMNLVNPQTKEVSVFPKEIENLMLTLASQGGVVLENASLSKKNRELIQILDYTNRKLTEENKLLRSKVMGQFDFSKIIGQGSRIKKVFDLMSRVLESDATVLVTGETGTGKELIANAIHYNSPRRHAEFVAQNCAALPEQLLESELFGYKKGAFSGANTDKKGLIELADKGTLFLDEIGDMPLGLQVKMLRVLQEKEVRPLGGVESKKINLRVVAATHCDLQQKIAEGKFREDLFYRLSVYPIELPALRERREDIPLLLQYFLDNLSKLYEKNIAGFSPLTLDLLMKYAYPGNIREMRNIVERAVLLCVKGGTILPEYLPNVFSEKNHTENSNKTWSETNTEGSLKTIVEKYEAQAIRNTLEDNGWNQTKTAAALGIGRRTLITKINRYRIGRH